MTKVQSHVMLVLHNMRTIPSNVRKIKGITECDKSTVTCDFGTTQYENGAVKCEKKKGTTKCDKKTVICDDGTA